MTKRLLAVFFVLSMLLTSCGSPSDGDTVKLPKEFDASVAELLKSEKKGFEYSYDLKNADMNELKSDSRLRFVHGTEFTSGSDGISVGNGVWDSVGFTELIDLPYTAKARLYAGENEKGGADQGIMIGIRCPSAADLHIDGGLWFVFRENSVMAYVKPGLTAYLGKNMPFDAADGLEVMVEDNRETAVLYVNGAEVGRAAFGGDGATLTDGEGTVLGTVPYDNIAMGDNMGHVRLFSHFANGTVGAMSLSAEAPPYEPEYDRVAVRSGYTYAFAELEAFKGDTPAFEEGGTVYCEAGLLADIFGFSCNIADGRAVLKRDDAELEFVSGKNKVVINGKAKAFPTVLMREGRLFISADYFGRMLGYTASVSEGTAYLSGGGEVSDEQKQALSDRYELYESVIYSDTEVAFGTEGVGKYGVSDPSERLVGIAYSTFIRSSVAWGVDTWDVPLYGTYTSDDREAIYRHGVQLAEAGVDFVFVDWSNNSLYDPETMRETREDFRIIEESTDLLFEIWSEIPNAPKICIFAGPGPDGMMAINEGHHQKKVDQIYNSYVTGKYADMYFRYKEKPLLICYGSTPTQVGRNPEWTDDRFTVRWVTGFIGQQRDLFSRVTLKSSGYWSWEERGTQTFTVDDDGVVEAITCVASYRAQFKDHVNDYIAPAGRENGLTFKTQFARARALGARVALIVSWNEWTVNEQLSEEISKDMEPSKAHGTFYYDLMCEEIRKFKAGE